MIEKNDVLSIHKVLIEKYGGIHGVRDENALDSAINRPYGIFDGKEFYPTVEEKSAAIIESIIVNHPFLDGNKRIGYVVFRIILLNGGKDIKATEEEKYEFVIGVASGELRYDGILSWIKSHIK